MGGGPGVPERRAAAAVDWEAIESSPSFRRLATARRRLVTALMALATAGFVVYVLLLILGGDGFLADGLFGSFTWGMLLVIVMTAFTFVVTVLYSRESNREIDGLVERARADTLDRGGAP